MVFSNEQKRHLELTTDVKSVCDILFANSDIESFNYVRLYDDGSRITLCSESAWLEHYFKQGFHTLNSLQQIPEMYDDKIFLWQSALESPIIKQAEAFNICHGMTLIQANNSYTEFINFGSTREHHNIVSWYLNNVDSLFLFRDYFLEASSEILKKAIKNKIPCGCSHDLVKEHLEKKEASNASALKESICQEFEKQITIIDGGNKILINKREIQTLMLLQKGLTAKQIAKKLQLSPRTIEVYIANLNEKFEVSAKSMLVEKVSSLPVNQTLDRLYKATNNPL